METTIKRIEPLRLPWKTQDPFIFCSYHYDIYPSGNDELGPADSLEGRVIGQDFSGKDGWSMYHGRKVPGFPAHPHCGFETVSIVTKGMVDHSDSLGAKGRFGEGDVQWMTAGKGVQHAEMFPLLNADKNPFEIFQIWLNLPASNKKVEPHYKMLWQEDIPKLELHDKNNSGVKVKLIAGALNGIQAPDPAPNSWVADKANNCQIWLIEIEANGKMTINKEEQKVTRSLYFYDGDSIQYEDISIDSRKVIDLKSDKNFSFSNGSKKASFLFLQGKPINEPIVQHGPFVATSNAGIMEATTDFQRTGFGGWPWDSPELVHDKFEGRFALYSNGDKEVK